MVDKPDNEKDSVRSMDDEEAQRPLAGRRLAEARRARDVSIGEIAKELHLDEPKVQALEENQFDALGAPVFAKGHLRKYAELVGVPIDDVLADYYQLNRSAGAPPVVAPQRRQPRDVKLGPWIAIILAVAILGAGLYWVLNREPAPENVRTPGVLEPYAEDDIDTAGAEVAPEPVVESPPVEQTADTDEAAENVSPAEAEVQVSAPPPAPTDGQVTLTMSFTGDCWTEVTDAEGRRLYFGMGQAGQTITRTGMPPLQALFGNRNNVSITVNGSDFSIDSGILRGNTTRVTIE